MFFHPPKDLPTTVFAALPEEWKNADKTNEWGQLPAGGGPTSSLLEGPSFDREGNLWCVDLPNGRIYRIGADGVFTKMAEYDGWPNGLKFHRDGRIFIADYKHGIMVMDPVSGQVAPYLVRANLERFKAVNDLFFSANGDLYFTDQGLTGLQDPTGRLFRVRPDGQVSCLLDNVPSPNGLVMNLDESMIYLAVTRANAIWRVPLLPDGGVAKVGVFVQMSGGWGGPDGAGARFQGAAGDRACRHGLGLGRRPPRRAGLPHPHLPRAAHDQRRVRRPGRAQPVHHGIGQRDDPARRAGRAGQDDVLAPVRPGEQAKMVRKSPFENSLR